MLFRNCPYFFTVLSSDKLQNSTWFFNWSDRKLHTSWSVLKLVVIPKLTKYPNGFENSTPSSLFIVNTLKVGW